MQATLSANPTKMVKHTQTIRRQQPSGTQRYLLASSSHTFYCTQEVPYSQALRLDEVGSNEFFDKN